jgi:hypothetical protein
MDIAYDHIQEEVISPDEAAQQAGKEKKGDEPTLNEEFAQAYKAISSSPWGARFGAFVGTVKKQVSVVDSHLLLPRTDIWGQGRIVL